MTWPDRGKEIQEDCSHRASRYLGSGGSMSYRQCHQCRAVIVSSADRELLIPAAGS